MVCTYTNKKAKHQNATIERRIIKMGITIKSKRYECYVGAFGFDRFRMKVASEVSEEIYTHFNKANDPAVMLMNLEEQDKFCEEFDIKTEELIDSGRLSLEVADFLLQVDTKGSISSKQANIIYKLIKGCDDDIIYGIAGRDNCAKMSDFKKIFSDKTKVSWE